MNKEKVNTIRVNYIGIMIYTALIALIAFVSGAQYTQDKKYDAERDQYLQVQAYNDGYRNGMLYAYDNVVVCGASAEDEGLRLAQIMGLGTVSSITCGE